MFSLVKNKGQANSFNLYPPSKLPISLQFNLSFIRFRSLVIYLWLNSVNLYISN